MELTVFKVGGIVFIDDKIKAKITYVGNTRCGVEILKTNQHDFIDVTRLSN